MFDKYSEHIIENSKKTRSKDYENGFNLEFFLQNTDSSVLLNPRLVVENF